MKRLVIMSLAVLINVSVFAQTKPQQPGNESDPNSKAILDKLSEKTKKFKTISIEFSYSVKNSAQNIDESQTGAIKIKGDMYKLTMGEQEIICDAKKVYTINKETKEIQVISVDEMDPDAINPKSMFTIYESGFKSKIKSEKTVNGVLITTIDLFPLNPKEKDFSIVRIDVDKNKLEVKKAMVLGKNGTHYTYSIKKMTPDTEIADSQFTFDKTKYPGYTIIE